MPNPGQHFEITRQVYGSTHPDLLLGSAMPDFRGMYADMYGEEHGTPNGTIGLLVGEDFHHQTDGAYDHRVPLVGEMKRPLVQQISAAVDRRIAGHCKAWSDVAMDGVLLEDRHVSELFYRVAGHVLRDETSLRAAHPDPRFEEFVKSYFARGIPHWYAEPAGLALSVQRRLAQRRQTKGRGAIVEDHDLPAIARGFADHIPRMRNAASATLGQTVAYLAARNLEETAGMGFPVLGGVQSRLGAVSGHESAALFPSIDTAGLSNESLAARQALLDLAARQNVTFGDPPLRNTDEGFREHGLASSLTHTSYTGWAGAAIGSADEVIDVGVDIEWLDKPKRSIARAVMTDEETEAFTPDLDDRFDVFVLSAKEAAYKALSRLAGNRRVGTRELQLEIVDREGETIRMEGVATGKRLEQELDGTRLEAVARIAGRHVFALAKTTVV